jgi:hypothetical protein
MLMREDWIFDIMKMVFVLLEMSLSIRKRDVMTYRRDIELMWLKWKHLR